MNLFKAVFVGCLAVTCMSGCHKAPSASGTAKFDVPRVDFQALLSRTDEIDVCTREITRQFNSELGPDILPSNFVGLSCKCTSENMRFMAAETDHTPELLNVAIQLAMNVEVRQALEQENGYAEFAEYMRNSGEKDFGFTHAEWSAFTKAVGTRADQFNEIDPEQFRAEIYEAAPSCAQFHELLTEEFPDFDHSPLSDDLDWFLAKQALLHDRGLSLTKIDHLLTTDASYAGCEEDIALVCAKKTGECPTKSVPELQELRCAALAVRTDKATLGMEYEQREFAHRYIAAHLYVSANRTTASQDSLDLYIDSKVSHLAISKSDLQAIRERIKEHEDTL